MLLPAATSPGNAGYFRALLGAMEASAVPIYIEDSFTCETGMSKMGTEMQLKKFCACLLILLDEM